MSNKHRLTAQLSESIVIGALMHNMDWMFLSEVSLKQADFSSLNHQVLYSILHERFLESNQEMSAEQLAIEAEKHPMRNKHTITIEMCKNYKNMVGSTSQTTFIKEVERLNKLKVLRSLDDEGFDVIKIIGPDSINAPRVTEIIDKYTVEEIVNIFRKELDTISESVELTRGKNSIQINDGIRELITRMQETPEIGMLLDGDIYNYLTRGALFGKFHLNAAPSGVGKTRIMVGNAVKIAMPTINEDGKIHYKKDGYGKVLFITTELTPEEIQGAVLASVSGVAETKIRAADLTEEDLRRINLAADIFDEYKDNFYLERISDPSTTSIKAKAETMIRRHSVEYIFFDYVFASAALGQEFSHTREDVALMHMSNTLKDIAADHGIYMMSATQVNGDWIHADFRGANLVRGSKAIVDKIDVGMITLPLMEEERRKIEPIVQELGYPLPNIVCDIYKNRSGEDSHFKIFRLFDKGTCRMTDLFLTNQYYEIIPVDRIYLENTFDSDELIFIEGRDEE